MSHNGLPPLRVEQAYRLLPDLDVLAPLRALLASMSRIRPAAEPHRTVGKRQFHPAELRERLPNVLDVAAQHLRALYEAAVAALEADQRRDMTATVHALLRCGEIEERAGRLRPALTWYQSALECAEELQAQGPEIEALRHMAQLELARGEFEAAARYFQRGLVLAEAEQDEPAAARCCKGLGDAALAQMQTQGAFSWYTRGLAHAGDDRGLAGALHFGLAEVAIRRQQLDLAEERLDLAHATLAAARDERALARCLDAAGRIATLRRRFPDALLRFREAFAHLRGAGGDPALEVEIRESLCRLFLDWGRLPDAEDEVRKGEETAIAHNWPARLARLYMLMGRIRGAQADDTGFVFFEKAIELSRGPEPNPRLEAEIYTEYGRFRELLHDADEADVCFRRAREILETLGVSGPAPAVLPAVTPALLGDLT